MRCATIYLRSHLLMAIQKPLHPRQGRLAIGASVIVICLFLSYVYSKHADSDGLIEWRKNLPKPSFKTLDVFKKSQKNPPWLIGTSITASAFQRRTLIRGTWQRLYNDPDRWTTRFFISNATDLLRPLIQAENETFGDLHMLEQLYDSKETATSVKPFEWFKYLTSQPESWEFVSKMDEDSFLDAKTFFDEWLEPMRGGPEPPSGTLIARTLGPHSQYDFTWPGGQFLTLTWDLVQILSEFYTTHGVPNGLRDDDVLVAYYLMQSGVNYTFTDMPSNTAFDWNRDSKLKDDELDSPWSKEGTSLMDWSHPVGEGAINPHKMKDDKDYLQVAACFDENGLKLNEWKKQLKH